MARVSFAELWTNAVKSSNYANSITVVWQGTNDILDGGLAYYERKVQAEKRKLGCEDEDKTIILSPSQVALAESTNALEELGASLVKAARKLVGKQSICKHIEQSSNYRLYEAFRAARGILSAAPLVGGLAVFNFIAGGISAILPDGIKGHFLNAIAWVNQQTYFLLNFNLQLSDEELDKQSYRFIGLAGQTGEILGKSLGWIACGLSATAGVAVINKAQARRILAEVGAEGIEEISEELWALARMGQRQAQRAAFLQIFKNARRWLKDPKNPFYPLLVAKFGQSTIDSWGNANNKPWSVNMAVQEWIETFNSIDIQDSLEEVYEGLIEGCQESFICFAGSFSEDLLPRQRKTIAIDYKEIPALRAN